MKKYINYLASFLKDFKKRIKWSYFFTYLIIVNLLTVYLTEASLNNIILMDLLFFILLFLFFVLTKLDESNKK